MKRDMELIRTLMLRFEEWPWRHGTIATFKADDPNLQIDGYTRDEVLYHLGLIYEAGFLKNCGARPLSSYTYCGLTNQGHDFIDSVRSPEVWQKTTEVTKNIGTTSLSVVVDIAKAIGAELLKKAMGLS